MNRASSLRNFTTSLPSNIFSGFVVSLIALPLGLGLAAAADIPPFAGIITAIVGGFVVALFGGSILSITGPGNGLVLVLLYSVTFLGEGDSYMGYLYTLAAIVCSGCIIFLFGVFRLGGLSEFFPASALQGMLAAIGIGIIAKQIHVMLGITSVSGSSFELLSQVPNSLRYIIENPSANVLTASILGVGSLLLLFFYSKIKHPVFHIIPAPMWVLIFGIGLVYYFDIFQNGVVPIEKELFVSIPDNLFSNLPFPNFEKIASLPFWSIVFSLTLISSIESLLSIKAVDKLDPLKRRSNVNKDLRALGLATTISGFLGGLNVVTVIARSSVNVNNGATNRSSNFFHALFLLLFVLLFQEYIQRISLPSLAAILVFTGYKLASPQNFARVLNVGKEQLVIFLITLFSTLYSGIVVGIGIGVLVTFLTHIIVNKNILLFTRNLVKPNVLLFQEQESENYYISVKNFCSFLNFFKLKAKLDEIPRNAHVILDFSFCYFIDHTVMEGVGDYRYDFFKKGGELEVIGLDIHLSETQHPFSLRKTLPFVALNKKTTSLTKRQLSLQDFAEEMKWEYSPEIKIENNKIEVFDYFKTKNINYRYNEVIGENNAFQFFDLSYSEGAFIAQEKFSSSFLLLCLDKIIPTFVLNKESLLHFLDKTQYSEVVLNEFPDFSSRFFLAGERKKELKSFFTKELIYFFESHSYYYVESFQNYILIKKGIRLSSIHEVKKLITFGTELSK